MKLEGNIERKFVSHIKDGNSLKVGKTNGLVKDDEHSHACKGWLVSAQNLVYLVVNKPMDPYRKSVDAICLKENRFRINHLVGDVVVILDSLLNDIKNGLVGSIENQTKALVFDDFLDYAKEYSKQDMKNESVVIAGVVLEDTLRNICRANEIEERGVKLDQLITDLTKSSILTQLKAKRARAAAHVRTKATHAQWDEFSINDVNATIQFVEELITENFE